jgi:asparagine synthase (glutamine-hydrolysing)
MCGICGIARLDGAAVDGRVLDDMSAALEHRGPDSAGRVIDGPVGLAARRLSIIDLAGGDQPITNETGDVHVVQNGEIYNHAALRAELEAAGHRFRTRSDTEVLVHLYEEHGPGFAARLRGMFAVAVWDARRRRGVLARDRHGIKPLFYRLRDRRLSFASELTALARDPAFRRDIDGAALEAFLAFNSVPAPLTIFREARKLRGRLRDSVRAHLVADVPVGVFLSGGVDSSAIAALAAEESGARLRTFSIGFEERDFDELGRARRVAERIGSDHHELVVRPDAAELLTTLAGVFDEPLGDSSALPTYLVSRLAASEVKVVLSGEGGDELFGGYFTYVADTLAPRVAPLAAAARPLVERLPTGDGRVGPVYMAKRFTRAARLPPLERHHGWKEVFSAEARAGLLGRPDLADVLAPHRARYARSARAEPLARLQDVDLGTYLVDDLLVKTDRASMAHSLEVRVPFLDPAVTDLALALRTSAKVRGLAKKRLLRRAVAPLVPAEVIRGRKRGFSIPAARWLRGPLLPFAREVLAPDRIRRQGLLAPAAVTAVLDAHAAGREDLSRQLWGLMSLSLWHDRHAA